MSKKKRDFSASELVQIIARKYGFEDKLFAFEVKKFLEEYLDASLFSEIKKVDYQSGTLTISIASPLLKNAFRMRSDFYLAKFNAEFGEGTFHTLIIR